MKSTSFLALLAAAALLSVLGVSALMSGRPLRVPDITVTDLHGGKIHLRALRGHPLVVNFWAPSCAACVEELPDLASVYRDFNPKGLKVIGIVMAYEPPNRVVEFSRAHNISYPVALDIDSDAAHAFGGVDLAPTTFLIDPEGRVVQHRIGKLDPAALRTWLAGFAADTQLKPNPAESY